MTVVLDFDGTLITCEPRQSAVLHSILIRYGVELDLKHLWEQKREGVSTLRALEALGIKSDSARNPTYLTGKTRGQVPLDARRPFFFQLQLSQILTAYLDGIQLRPRFMLRPISCPIKPIQSRFPPPIRGKSDRVCVEQYDASSPAGRRLPGRCSPPS